MKECSSCKEILPEENFGKNRHAPDGLNYYCKSCRRKHYLERRDKAISRAAQNYRNNRDSILESKKKYYRKNKARKTEYNQDYYIANREAIRKKQKEWQAANPEKVRELSQRRRALILNATIDMPDNYWQILLDTYGPYCMSATCDGEDPVLTHDHVVPLSRGGMHSLSNSQILCKTCNCKKGTKTIDYRRIDDE